MLGKPFLNVFKLGHSNEESFSESALNFITETFPNGTAPEEIDFNEHKMLCHYHARTYCRTLIDILGPIQQYYVNPPDFQEKDPNSYRSFGFTVMSVDINYHNEIKIVDIEDDFVLETRHRLSVYGEKYASESKHQGFTLETPKSKKKKKAHRRWESERIDDGKNDDFRFLSVSDYNKASLFSDLFQVIYISCNVFSSTLYSVNEVCTDDIPGDLRRISEFMNILILWQVDSDFGECTCTEEYADQHCIWIVLDAFLMYGGYELMITGLERHDTDLQSALFKLAAKIDECLRQSVHCKALQYPIFLECFRSNSLTQVLLTAVEVLNIEVQQATLNYFVNLLILEEDRQNLDSRRTTIAARRITSIVQQRIVSPGYLPIINRLMVCCTDSEAYLTVMKVLFTLLVAERNCDITNTLDNWWETAVPLLIQAKCFDLSDDLQCLQVQLEIGTISKLFLDFMKTATPGKLTAVYGEISERLTYDQLRRTLLFSCLHRTEGIKAVQLNGLHDTMVVNIFVLLSLVRKFVLFDEEKVPVHVAEDMTFPDQLLIEKALELLECLRRRDLFRTLNAMLRIRYDDLVSHYEGLLDRYLQFFRSLSRYLNILEGNDTADGIVELSKQLCKGNFIIQPSTSLGRTLKGVKKPEYDNDILILFLDQYQKHCWTSMF